MDSEDISQGPMPKVGLFAPLAIPAYRNFWIAGLFSNIGTWMHETGAIWLMTDLRPSPEMVASVRVAMALPVFCLALPAGVWADRFDRRTWLISTQLLLLTIALAMAVFSLLGWMTPELLLGMTALMGIAMILNLPAWQALTPELVPPDLIPSAVQAGSVSFNLARSVGPAVAGILIARFGTGAAFLFNAVSFLGILVALLLWRPKAQWGTEGNSQPEELGLQRPDDPVQGAMSAARPNAGTRFFVELLKGLAVIRGSITIRNTMIRVLVFTFSASSLWSLLSLVATEKLGFREKGFGVCLTLLGVGAVLAAGIQPWIRQRFTSDRIVLIAQLLMGSLLLVISWTESARLIFAALLVVGACWMFKMTTLNATAQVRLPREFRARGMSVFVMSFALGMSLGGVTWGWLARLMLLDNALATAGCVMAAMALATHRLTLGSLQAR